MASPRREVHGLSHPGETIEKWLVSHRRSQKWLAEQIGVTEKHLSRIVRGHAIYSAELAVRIEAATKLSARRLMRLRADYEVEQVRGQG